MQKQQNWSRYCCAVGLDGPKESCIRWGPDPPTERGNLERNGRQLYSIETVCHELCKTSWNSVRHHRKTLTCRRSRIPCRRRQKNYDVSTWRWRYRRQKIIKSRQTFDKHSCDLLTAIMHTKILVAYFIIMVALCNRETIYIFMLWFVLLFFFPRLISAAGDWMFTILWHMVWP